MMYCPACNCNANVCINCYKLFHEKPDVVGKKKSPLKRKLGIKDKKYNDICKFFGPLFLYFSNLISYIDFIKKHSIFHPFYIS